MKFLAIMFIVILFILFIFSIWLKNRVKALNIVHKPDELKIGKGKKSAIIIYQKSKHDSMTKMANVIADCLAKNDYTVTINYPSDEVNYVLKEYDLIVFGSCVYIGRPSPVLSNYIMKNRFRDKKVLIYTVGLHKNDNNDLNELKVLLDVKNEIHMIKVSKRQENELREFVYRVIVN